MDRLKQKGYKNQRRIGNKFKITESWRIEITGDFSVLLNPYFCKIVKKMMLLMVWTDIERYRNERGKLGRNSRNQEDGELRSLVISLYY